MRCSWASSGCQNPPTASSAVGLACSPSMPQVHASNSSSSVPAAPGSATKTSARSAMRALRSCMEATTSSRGSPGWASSSSTRCCGMTPTTSPPAASAASATTPISPTCPPPYTIPTPARARPAAKAAAALRCDGGPDCEPVKTATRTPRSAPVGPGDPLRDADRLFAPPPLRDADRLVAALELDGDGKGVLQPAGDLLAVLEHDPGTDLGADRHRRGETDLVQAVVDAHLRVRDPVGPGRQRNQQREGHEPVRDRAAVGALGLGPLDVDVDPLVVTGGVGEEVDRVLGHLVPVARSQLLAHEAGQLRHGRRRGHAAILPAPAAALSASEDAVHRAR